MSNHLAHELLVEALEKIERQTRRIEELEAQIKYIEMIHESQGG